MHARQLAALVVVLVGCSGGGQTRDVASDRERRHARAAEVDAGTPSTVAEVPAAGVNPSVKSNPARVFAHASAHALAIDATHVFYGDTETDGIYAMAKAGGEPVRLARHAPVAGAIALDSEFLTWIASPGDAVLSLPLKGGGEAREPTTLRDRGIFSNVTSASGDIFVTEALGAGGALLRVTGSTVSRIAMFDGPPRALAADTTHAYVFTPTRVLRSSHGKGALETLATGAGFAHAQIDERFLYFVADVDKARVVARLSKTGGALTALARDVRDVPIEFADGEIFYLDAARPQLRAVPVTGGPSRPIAEHEMFRTATAIVAVARTVYVATGAHESGSILAVDRR